MTIAAIATAIPNSEMAKIFKALSDANRLEVLQLLKEGEQCACVLLEKLDVSQSGLSYHMKILEDAQLITSRIEGKWTKYTLNQQGIKQVKQILDTITL